MEYKTVKAEKSESQAVEQNEGAVAEVKTVSTTSRKTQAKKQVKMEPKVKAKIVEPTIFKPLRTVPFESGFHFYTSIGNYTGVTATNLSEFAAKLQTVPEEAITFHFQRKDFQKWIQFTIKDVALADRISRMERKQPVEDLRKEILRIVKGVLLHI